MSLLGIIVRNLVFYPLNELCDFELIDEDPGLSEEKSFKETLGNQYSNIKQYC